jgi:hypothetical protein
MHVVRESAARPDADAEARPADEEDQLPEQTTA